MDAAVGAAAAKVHEEKMILETVRQAGAGKVGQAGRAAGDIGDGRHQVGGLAVKMGVPEFLRVERSARVRIFHELITNTPAAVAPFHEVHPAGLIAAVGVVVAGEEISVCIEYQVLRIAQSEAEHFQTGPVRVAAKDATRVGLAHAPTVGELDIRAAVPDAEINLAVGTKVHPVQIVADEPDAHAKAVMQRLANIGHAVAVGVAQQPEIRNVRIPHGAFSRQNARGDTVEGRVETLGKNGGMVGLAVAIAVLDQADALAVF